MTKQLPILVAKWAPVASFTWAISKLPGCFSMCCRTPTLPMLFPPVRMTWAPFSNLMRPSASPVCRLSYKKLLNINYIEIAYLNWVEPLDFRMGVSNGSSIVSNNVRNFVGSHRLLDDFAELELSFLLVNFVSLELSLGIVEESEVLSCSFNADYVHHAKRISRISSDFVVNLDHSFLVDDYCFHFLCIQSIL